jgi:uncharacterized protein YkwD
MWGKLVVAWAIAVLVVAGPRIAAASAKSKSSKAGSCAGAYVVATDAASLAKASAAVVCLVNRERASRGLGALRGSTPLASAATGHSDDMIAHQLFSHTGSDGSSVFQRVTRAGYRWRAAAEALAFGASKRSMPSRLVASMMQSREHRTILLDRTYRDLGVGLALGAPTRGAAGAASTLTLVFASS